MLSSSHLQHSEPSRREVSMPAVQVVDSSALTIIAAFALLVKVLLS